MTNLESLVREALAAHEQDAPDGAELLQRVRERAARRRRHGWSAVVLAAAATTAVVVGVAVAAPDERATVTPPVVESTEEVTPTSTPSSTPMPPDTQAVSFHGVEVLVPRAWPINALRCGTPMADTVVVHDGGATEACLIRQPPGLTVVTLTELDPTRQDPRAELATEAATVSGRPALRGRGTPELSQTELAVLVLPNPGVVVSVESPDPAYADELLDTVRIVPVDSVGCRDHLHSLLPRGPARAGGSDNLVPGEPVTAAICRYTGDWLARSGALSGEELDELVDILNALPAGTSTPGPGYFASDEICAEDAHRGFVIQFQYATGEPLAVSVQISGCTTFGATNGSRATKIDDALVTLLLTRVGYDGGFPDPRELR